MIRIGSIRSTAVETLNPADFDELVQLFGPDVETPGNRAGWATCTVAGRRFRTHVPAPGKDHR